MTLLFVMGYYTGIGQNISVPGTDFSNAKAVFSELKECLKNDGGKLWNHKLDGPVMLVNRETRALIANQPDGKGELVKMGSFYIGTFPENLNISNSAFNWNGIRWTVVALPLPDTKYGRINLLVHELFHRIQPMIGFGSLSEIQCTHLDSKEGRICLKLELEALKAALKSDHPEQHLRDALLFRQYRRQLFPEAKIAENSLELYEGVAEYTGAILSGRNKTELQEHLVSEIDQFFGVPSFVRSFAYITVPVYGYFMQQADGKWNLKINNNTDLTSFINTFFKTGPSEPGKKEIQRLGKSYGIKTITAFEEKREITRLEQKKTYRARFLGNNALVIGLEDIRIGFYPGNLFPLDSLGTVYPNLRITDNWGILEVDSCGALISKDWQHVTIGPPLVVSDTMVSGNGWKLKLNSRWKVEKEAGKYKLITR